MASVLIYVALAIGLVSIAGYATFSFYKSYEVASLSQRNVARMDEIGTVLRANLWSDPQGIARAPLGDSDSIGKQRLPSWIISDDKTPWGAPYGYCPLAPGFAGQGTATVSVNGATSSYDVDTVNVSMPSIINKPFVVAARPGFSLGGPAADYAVGLVLSPSPYHTDTPDCSSVIFRNGFYVIDPSKGTPGSVTVVSSQGTIMSSATQGLTSARFDSVVYVSPSGGGNLSGADVADPMAYPDAYRLWLAVQPRVTSFEFSEGQYNLTSDLLDFRSDLPARSVRFNGHGTVAFNGASGTVRLVIADDFVLRDISAAGNITIEAERGAHVLVKESAIENFAIWGGQVDVDVSSQLINVQLTSGMLHLGNFSGWLQPATLGQGLVPAASPSHGGNMVINGLIASGGDIVVDGINLNPSGQSLPQLMAPARINLVNNAQLAGSSVVDEPIYGGCTASDAYGRLECRIICDVVHPFVREGSCEGTGGLLTAFGRTKDPSSGIEGYHCGWRQDQPLTQKQVLIPTPDGQPMPPGIGTAVDNASAPAFVPGIGGYCSTNP